MKSIMKLLRRCMGILLLSGLLLLILNLAALAVLVSGIAPNASPWSAAEKVAGALAPASSSSSEKTGDFRLTGKAAQELQASGAWGLLLDDQNGEILWQAGPIPEGLPKSFSLSDVASLTRGYLNDFPTFPARSQYGLVVLGFPKTSYWKHMYSSWDYNLIRNSPYILLYFLIGNAAAIFIIYMAANTKLFASISPLLKGISALSEGKGVYLKESGALSELAVSINRTSEILKDKDSALRKKETARANWIAGVSHDIRTPLSMVMGYAGQLESDSQLPSHARQKASIIRRQSERMKNLINDLNLASKLEYNMQPFHLQKVNLVACVRQVAVDFLNLDPDGKYPCCWMTEDDFTCLTQGDPLLLKRAVSNLIQNSINHNPEGCTIYLTLFTPKQGQAAIRVEDDGVGASQEEIDRLNHTPHYMVCDDNTMDQRHGLGLLIVKQIAAAHKGTVVIGKSWYGGFQVTILLPVSTV